VKAKPHALHRAIDDAEGAVHSLLKDRFARAHPRERREPDVPASARTSVSSTHAVTRNKVASKFPAQDKTPLMSAEHTAAGVVRQLRETIPAGGPPRKEHHGTKYGEDSRKETPKDDYYYGYGYGYDDHGVDPLPIRKAVAASRGSMESSLQGYLRPLDSCSGKQNMPSFLSQGQAVDEDGRSLSGFGERTFRQSLFSTEFKFGVPKISAMNSGVQLAGVFGVRHGVSVDQETLMVASTLVEPIANLVLKFDSVGEAGGFVGGIVTQMNFFQGSIPVQATLAPLKQEVGFNFAWDVTAMQAKIDAFQRGPGIKCPGSWTKDGKCMGNEQGEHKKWCIGRDKSSADKTVNDSERANDANGTRDDKQDLGDIDSLMNSTNSTSDATDTDTNSTSDATDTDNVAGTNGTNGTNETQREMERMLKKKKDNMQVVGKEDLAKINKKVAEEARSAKTAATADVDVDTSSVETSVTDPKKIPCTMSPCNVWWVPPGSGCPANSPCSWEVGCGFLTGKTRPKPMHDWKGFTEKADLMGWDPSCYTER